MGFEEIWSLVGAFDEFDEVIKIQLAEWDTHPNVKGHKLLGDKLFDVLLEHEEVLMDSTVVEMEVEAEGINSQ